MDCRRTFLLLVLSLVVTLGACAHVPAVAPVPPEGPEGFAIPPYPRADPAVVKTRLAKARRLTAQQQYAEAIAELRLALQEAPLVVESYQELGWNLIRTQQWREARQLLHVASALDPDASLSDVLLGHTFLLTGDTTRAHLYYTKAVAALESDPHLTRKLLTDLDVFIQQGWHTPACRHAQERIQDEVTQTASWRALNTQRAALTRSHPPQEALKVAQEAVRVAESTFGSRDLRVAMSLRELAKLHQAQQAFPEAEAHYQQALAIQEYVWGPDHLEVARPLEEVAALAFERRQYPQAEPLYQRALRILKQSVGDRQPRVAILLNALALVAQNQGQYAQAKLLYSNALAIWEHFGNPAHPDVAIPLVNLASLYRLQGQREQAEQLFQQALRIWEATGLSTHPEIARIYLNLGNLWQDQKRYAEAASHYERALRIWEATVPPTHPERLRTQINLATLYRVQHQLTKALKLAQQVLKVQQRMFPAEHPDMAFTLHTLATIYNDQEQYNRAEPYYRQALDTFTATFGPLHPHVATTHHDLALLYINKGQPGKALAEIRQATEIYQKRAQHVRSQRAHEAWSEQADARSIVADHMQLLFQAAACAEREATLDKCERPMLVTDTWRLRKEAEALAGRETPPNARQTKLWAEALEVSQLAQASRTATVIAHTAARFASGHDALAQTLRTYQDIVEQRHNAENRLVQAFSQPLEPQKASRLPALRAELENVEKRLSTLQQTLERTFPAYAELALLRPVTLAELGALLQADEALLSYVVWEHGIFLLVVRPPQQIRVYPIALGAADLQHRVDRLRVGLDQRPATPLNALEPFPVQHAYELYTAVVAPAIPFLEEGERVRHLWIVPDGALHRLPFSVFVTAPPQESGRGNLTAYRQVAWLAQRYALTVLPAPGTLRALRAISRPPEGQPVVGFGDPRLAGAPGSQLERSSLGQCPQEAAAVRQLPALPGSRVELDAIRHALQGDLKHIYRQERATKPRIQTMQLTPFRYLALPTHALGAGCYGLTEPALVFTPPARPSPKDNGLLTASEIAQLRLNTDWTLLTGCNTAALEGTPGTAGLPSLARAFFYAGSRALLVSHWAVDDKATARLVAETLTVAARSPQQRRAAALQAAMETLRQDPTQPHFAHPMFWAPFVVMGDGGPLRRP